MEKVIFMSTLTFCGYRFGNKNTSITKKNNDGDKTAYLASFVKILWNLVNFGNNLVRFGKSGKLWLILVNFGKL